MPDTAIDPAFRPRDSVTVSIEARAAAIAGSPAEHVWHLEFALCALRRCASPAVIDADTRDFLARELVDAMDTSHRLLAGFYSAEQIEDGYRAAHGILDAWTIPLDEGRKDQKHGVYDLVLGMFLFDVVNMRRIETLTRKLCGASLDAVLPPLPQRLPLDPGVVVPFPRPKRPRHDC